MTLVDRSDATAIVGDHARRQDRAGARGAAAACADLRRHRSCRRWRDVSRCVWGVVPVLTDLSGDINAAAARIAEDLVASGAIARVLAIVVVSVTPDLARGPSNF